MGDNERRSSVEEWKVDQYTDDQNEWVRKMESDPMMAIRDLVTNPQSVGDSMRLVEYDDEGLSFFVDPKVKSLVVGIRDGHVGNDGTADFVVFLSWNKMVKRDPPSMKKTKSWREEQTHVTWARVFLEADRTFEDVRQLRDHLSSQQEYCGELNDDWYTGLNRRLIGRRADDGPYGDDITMDWIADKLDGGGA